MSLSQPAILAPTASFALFVLLKVKDASSDVMKHVSDIHQMVELLNQSQPHANVKASVAFSPSFCLDNQIMTPKDFHPFRPLGHGDTYAPATDCDILLHLHSNRHDLNFYLFRQLMAKISQHVEIIDETYTFRYLDSRDLTGFIDGTENPQTKDDRAKVGIIAEGECAGGSFVMVQRYVHHLEAWEPMQIAQQEKVIGRTKPDSIELENNEETSHVGRVDLKENGQGLKILRHSLPYGTVSGEHGLLFISYCREQRVIQTLLESMFGERDGKTDHLLHFTKPVTGAYFYAPSVDALKAMINR